MNGTARPQKVIPMLFDTVVSSLRVIFFDGFYADKVIERVLKSNQKWGARDRRFIAETVYDVLRNWRLYAETATQYPNPIKSEDINTIVAIHLVITGRYSTELLQHYLPMIDISERVRELCKARALKYSIPDWLDEYGSVELGERWEKELASLNEPADVYLRVNTLKTSIHDLQRVLREDGVETDTIADYPDALRLVKRSNIFKTRGFHEGLFEVQDIGSQAVAPFLAPEPGERIIDACAGGGGKTLHMATLMKNRGKIIALDTDEKKLAELSRRARRNGISIIECRTIESTKTIKRLEGSADRLLLDVPCSGIGVLRRNPDAKWKLNREKIHALIVLQANILNKYPAMLKSGGMLVYATCSVFPSENTRQVTRYLSENPQVQLIAQNTLTPAANGTDGFYFAKLQKGSGA